MKTFQISTLNALFALGLGLAGCGGTEQDQDQEMTDDAICADWPDCLPTRPPRNPPPPPARADLVPEIASGFPGGFACPVGNGDTVSIRVRNQGNAAAGRFVVRTEVTLYTGIQYYTYKQHFLVNSLAAGAVTTLGVQLGDGVNGYPGSDGVSTPMGSMLFYNYVPSGWSSGTHVIQWRVLADTSSGASWYGNCPDCSLFGYPDNQVTESNESNNIIMGTSSSCTFPSAPVFTQG